MDDCGKAGGELVVGKHDELVVGRPSIADGAGRRRRRRLLRRARRVANPRSGLDASSLANGATALSANPHVAVLLLVTPPPAHDAAQSVDRKRRVVINLHLEQRLGAGACRRGAAVKANADRRELPAHERLRLAAGVAQPERLAALPGRATKRFARRRSERRRRQQPCKQQHLCRDRWMSKKSRKGLLGCLGRSVELLKEDDVLCEQPW